MYIICRECRYRVVGDPVVGWLGIKSDKRGWQIIMRRVKARLTTSCENKNNMSIHAGGKERENISRPHSNTVTTNNILLLLTYGTKSHWHLMQFITMTHPYIKFVWQSLEQRRRRWRRRRRIALCNNLSHYCLAIFTFLAGCHLPTKDMSKFLGGRQTERERESWNSSSSSGVVWLTEGMDTTTTTTWEMMNTRMRWR